MTKAILFDFDGTLANTAPGILMTMRDTYKAMGVRVPTDEEFRPTIGLPLVQGLQIAGNLNDEAALKAAEIYRSIFPTFELTHITIFPEVKETLELFASKGIRMAICTSRSSNSLESILSHHGIGKYFEMKITNSDNLPSKPAPDMVLALLDRMGLSKDEAIVVGDTTFDIQMGNGAGCKTVAVTYGNHSLNQLKTAEPSYIIDRFSQLSNIIFG